MWSRQPVILLLVALEHLLLAAFHTAVNLFARLAAGIETLQEKKIFAVAYVLRVGQRRGAFAEREIVKCIEQIGLSHTVVAQKQFRPAKTPGRPGQYS